MSAGNLKDFVEQQSARGKTRDEIRRHLESQGWDRAAIDSALAPDADPSPAPPAPRRSSKRSPLTAIVLAVLAVVLVGGALAAFFTYRQYAQAAATREKLRHVRVEGRAVAALSGADDEPGAPFELLAFAGDIDSSDLARPKTAFRVAADPAGGVAAALQGLTLDTDARFIGLSLLTVGAAGKLVGGVEWRLLGDDIYLRFERPPLGEKANLISSFVEGLVGPNILSNAWLRLPAAGVAGATDESRALWALMLRPTEQIFGHSKELAFAGKRDAEAIGGEPTEIHHYTVDGAWMTSLLADALARPDLQEPLALVAVLQKLATGKEPGEAGEMADIRISDGEMDVWVGQRDALPHRIFLTLKIREGDARPTVVQLRVEANFSYGKPAQIEAPAVSMSLEDLKKQIGALGAIPGIF